MEPPCFTTVYRDHQRFHQPVTIANVICFFQLASSFRPTYTPIKIAVFFVWWYHHQIVSIQHPLSLEYSLQWLG